MIKVFNFFKSSIHFCNRRISLSYQIGISCRTSQTKRRSDLDILHRNVKMTSEISSKPLNVLVYTGESPNEKCSRYESIANNLKFCLNPDCYLIYMLQPSQVLQDPWQENLKLLIVCSTTLDGKTAAVFEKYATGGGQILLICTGLEENFFSVQSTNVPKQLIKSSYKEFSGVLLQHGGISYQITDSHTLAVEDSKKKKILIRCELGKAVIVISEVHLVVDPALLSCTESEFTQLKEANSKRLMLLKELLSIEFSLNCAEQNTPDLTSCFLFVKEKNIIRDVVDKISATKYPAAGMQLLPIDFTNEPPFQPSTDKCLVVAFNVGIDVPFDKEKYFCTLKTETFGGCLFFIPVIGSTMDVVNVLSNQEGACVVARQQVSGKGRGGNKWISPVGSALFSTHFSVSLSSSLGQRLPIVQHFIGLSVILAVRKISGYEDIDIRLKWPNDIYYGKFIKLGGILVTSTIEGNTAHVFTGCGVNVSNSQPTMCINDVIQHYNASTGGNLAPLSVEYLIASSLTELENIIKDFEHSGLQSFLSLYYTYWVHDKQKVTLATTNEEVTIVGLNDFGFLLVERKNGELQALQPDGNSFDMLKNLISVK